MSKAKEKKEKTLKDTASRGSKLWAVVAIINFVLALAIVGYIVATDFIKKAEETETPKVIARYEATTIERFTNIMSAMFGYTEVEEDASDLDKAWSTVSFGLMEAWGHAFEEAEIPEATFYKFVVFLENYYAEYFEEGVTVKSYFDPEGLDKYLKAQGLMTVDEYNQNELKIIEYVAAGTDMEKITENVTNDASDLQKHENINILEEYYGFHVGHFDPDDLEGSTPVSERIQEIYDHNNVPGFGSGMSESGYEQLIVKHNENVDKLNSVIQGQADLERVNVYVSYIIDNISNIIVDLRRGKPVAGEDPTIFGVILSFVEQLSDLGIAVEEVGNIVYHGVDLSLETFTKNGRELQQIFRHSLDAVPVGTPLEGEALLIYLKAFLGSSAVDSANTLRQDWNNLGKEYVSGVVSDIINSVGLVVNFISEFSSESIGEMRTQIASMIKSRDDKEGINAAGKTLQNIFLSYKYELDSQLQYVYDKNNNIIGTQLFVMSDQVYEFCLSLETKVMYATSTAAGAAVNVHTVSPLLSAAETIVNTAGNMAINVLGIFEDLEFCKQMAIDMYIREMDKNQNRTIDVTNGQGVIEAINYLIENSNLQLDDQLSERIYGVFNVNVSVDEMLEKLYAFFIDYENNKDSTNDVEFILEIGSTISERIVIPRPLSQIRDVSSFALLLAKIIAKRNDMNLGEFDVSRDDIFFKTFIDGKDYFAGSSAIDILNEELNSDVSDDDLMIMAMKSVILRYYYMLGAFELMTLKEVVSGTPFETYRELELLEVTTFGDVGEMVVPNVASQTEIACLFKLLAAALSGAGDKIPVSYLSTYVIEREGMTDKVIGNLIASFMSLIAENQGQYAELSGLATMISQLIAGNLFYTDINYNSENERDSLNRLYQYYRGGETPSDGESNENVKQNIANTEEARLVGINSTDTTQEMCQKHNSYMQQKRDTSGITIPSFESLLEVPLDIEEIEINGVIKKYFVCKWVDGRLLSLATDPQGRLQISEDSIYLDTTKYTFTLAATDVEIANDTIIVRHGQIKYRAVDDPDYEAEVVDLATLSENVVVGSMLSAVGVTGTDLATIDYSKANGTYTDLEGVFAEVSVYYRNYTGKNTRSFASFRFGGEVLTADVYSYIEAMLREIHIRKIIELLNVYVDYAARESEETILTRYTISTIYDSTATASAIALTANDILSGLTSHLNALSEEFDLPEVSPGSDFYYILSDVVYVLSQNSGKWLDVGYKGYSFTTLERIVNAFNTTVSESEKIDMIGVEEYYYDMIIDQLEDVYEMNFGDESEGPASRMVSLLDKKLIPGITVASFFIDRLIDIHNETAEVINYIKAENESERKLFEISFFIYPSDTEEGYNFVYYQLYKLSLSFLSGSNTPLSYKFLTASIRALGSLPIATTDSFGNTVRFGEVGFYETLADGNAMFYAYEKTSYSRSLAVVDFNIDWKYNRSVKYYFENRTSFIDACLGRNLSDPTAKNMKLDVTESELLEYWDDNASIQTVFGSRQLFENILRANFNVRLASYEEVFENDCLGVKSSGVYNDKYDFLAKALTDGVKVKENGKFVYYALSKQYVYEAVYDSFIEIFQSIVGYGYYLTEFPSEVVDVVMKQVIKNALQTMMPIVLLVGIPTLLTLQGSLDLSSLMGLLGS